ncbi:MAG: Ig-like domain-containing protein [Clostridia bacterium]|nr:Ig-like domain-containing protein [Clostridia bacterium]
MKNKKILIAVVAVVAAVALALGLGLGLGLKHEVEVTGITLSKSELTMYEGNEETLNATVNPDNASNAVIWTSSDENIVKAENGKIISLSAGSATVTAEAGDKTATCNVTVKDKYKVTEDEWKNAFGIITINFNDNYGEHYDDSVFDSVVAKVNFSCNLSEDGGDDEKYTIVTSFDYDKIAFSMDTSMNEGEDTCYYTWKDNNKYYSGCITNANSVTEKNELDSEEKFNAWLLGHIDGYAGGMYVHEYGIVGSYSQFTYSEETNEYTATIQTAESGSAEVTVKIEEGKIVKFSYFQAEYGYTAVHTYTYGTTITIPAELLSMKVTD